MAGPKYYDVASGKPTSIFKEEIHDQDIFLETVDLLWRYAFDWVIIDRWTDKEIRVEEQNSRVYVPELFIEFSNDGKVFNECSFSYGIISSDKGSKGTHRSIRLIFDEPATGRHIRISYIGGIWKYKLRASLRTHQVALQEKAKLIEPLDLRQMVPDNFEPIRASVLGDSNSVMRYGWVKGLPFGSVEVVENVSLGSSSNGIHATQLPNLARTDIDVLLLQTTVNEYTPVKDRIYDVELSRQMIRHAQSWTAKNAVVPVYLIQPHRRALDDTKAGKLPFDHESYCIEVCEDLGIPYINGFSLVRKMARMWGRPEASLYSDPAHLSHPPAQALGAAIGACIVNFMRTEWQQDQGIVSADALTHDFSTLQLGEEPILTSGYLGRRRITTSLVDQEMLELRGGSEIFVPIPDGWEVVAFTQNARSCNASIRIDGANTVIRRADFAGYEGVEGFPFVCVRSLINPVLPSNGGVVISCVSPIETHEPDEITNDVPRPIPMTDLHLEISQIVLRSLDRTTPFMRVRNIDLNLTKSISMEFLTNN